MRLVGNNSTQSLISSAHVFSEVIMRGLRGEYASLLRSTQFSFCFQGWAWVRASPNCPPPRSTSECQGSIEPILHFWRRYTSQFPIPPTHTPISTQSEIHTPQSHWSLTVGWRFSTLGESTVTCRGGKSVTEFSPSFLFLQDFVLFLHPFLKLLPPTLVSH